MYKYVQTVIYLPEGDEFIHGHIELREVGAVEIEREKEAPPQLSCHHPKVRHAPWWAKTAVCTFPKPESTDRMTPDQAQKS